MIVTADPLGDYNATSQILRYSALAREVTVPRVPSLAGSIASVPSERGRSISGRISPSDGLTEELERAFAEIARLTKDCHNFAIRLAEEEIARSEAEHRLQAAEDRCVMIEQEVREECWADMEEQVEAERRRWQAAWDEQVSHLCLFFLDDQSTISLTRSSFSRLVDTMTLSTRKLSSFHAGSISTKTLSPRPMRESKNSRARMCSFVAAWRLLSARCPRSLPLASHAQSNSRHPRKG